MEDYEDEDTKERLWFYSFLLAFVLCNLGDTPVVV